MSKADTPEVTVCFANTCSAPHCVAATLETMAEATRNGGFEYFGVADHSKSAHYAGKLSVEQGEADRLNKGFGKEFRILKGIESDILADGSLDYSSEVLATFDFVVASIHGRFKLDREAQADRLLRASANPYTTIIGHVTGRQLEMARKGGEPADRVLNAMPLSEIAHYLRQRRHRSLARAA